MKIIKRIPLKVKEVIEAYKNHNEKIPSDILGSYTGNLEKGEKPIQDADDI